jgi:hypothetical protein
MGKCRDLTAEERAMRWFIQKLKYIGIMRRNKLSTAKYLK